MNVLIRSFIFILGFIFIAGAVINLNKGRGLNAFILGFFGVLLLIIGFVILAKGDNE